MLNQDLETTMVREDNQLVIVASDHQEKVAKRRKKKFQSKIPPQNLPILSNEPENV